jgi:hypothetical protein
MSLGKIEPTLNVEHPLRGNEATSPRSDGIKTGHFPGSEIEEVILLRFPEHVITNPLAGVPVPGQGVLDGAFHNFFPGLERNGIGQSGQVIGLDGATRTAWSAGVARREPPVTIAMAVGTAHPFVRFLAD